MEPKVAIINVCVVEAIYVEVEASQEETNQNAPSYSVVAMIIIDLGGATMIDAIVVDLGNVIYSPEGDRIGRYLLV